ncbi:MAG TPA: DUF2911 domain-containing protein [Terriglobia bacterium]|nr:DUF2911 domain-containing protein [Terriglobia bacterium]
MRRYAIAVFTLALGLMLAGVAFSQGNPRGLTKISVNGQNVSVEYGRPSLKGRSIHEMLDKLKPGAFWRLGADTSTTFTTNTDLKFGDVTIPKGAYSIWAERQSDNSWKLVFNKQHGQWGTSHDPSQDFASAPLKESQASNSTQLLNIRLVKSGDGGNMIVHWGNMELSTHFTGA